MPFTVMDWPMELSMNGIIHFCYADNYESRNAQTVVSKLLHELL